MAYVPVSAITVRRPRGSQRFSSCRRVTRAHLVGIGGTGMTALAELLLDWGWQVSGSDLVDGSAVRRLRGRGATIAVGHDANHVPPDAEVVVHSAAIDPANAERREAVQRGLRQCRYSQFVAGLMAGRRGIGVAGTHGKSTTTAMVAAVLEQAGWDPPAIVGAELCQWNASGRGGRGEWFVAECCEYQQSFLDLRPVAAAILNVEPDHFDCYDNDIALESAFGQFAASVPESGVVVAKADCPRTRRAVLVASAEVQTFSLNEGADWWAADLREHRGCYRFRVFYGGRFLTEIHLQVPGRHNVVNALAAAALCHGAGVRPKEIREGLGEFQGLRRRMEVLGSWRGVTLVSDYAHHPTEVRATLAAARQVFGGRRTWCVFQPHQVSRTKALFDEFSESFGDADHVVITEVFCARETAGSEALVSAALLGEAIRRRGRDVADVYDLHEIVRLLESELRPGDVLIAMGAGDVEKVCHAFTRRLQRHRRPE